MKKPFYTLSWMKQNVYTFLFCFLRLSCSYSSHSLHHPSGKELTHPPVKSSNFPVLKNHVSQNLLFVNVLTLSCLGSLWFATHPYYSLSPHVILYYLWSISIAKDRCFAEKCSPRLW